MHHTDFPGKSWWPERDAIARRFGQSDWDSLLHELMRGGILQSPKWDKEDRLTALWHQARLDAGLVILLRPGGAVVGVPATFSPDKMRAERQVEPGAFDDNGGLYIEALNPPPPLPHAYDVAAGFKQILFVVALLGVVSIAYAIRLVAFPVAATPLLLFGLWACGTAWLMYGDQWERERGSQPRWSIRRSGIGKWIPLSWFGPDRR